MADITFLTGQTLEVDDTDKYEYLLASERQTINPSVEFWLNENAEDLDKVLIVGAGFGLFSKIITDKNSSAEIINVEPNATRFSLLETNCPDETNINKACANESGNGKLYFYSDGNSGSQYEKVFGSASQDIEAITIDSLDLADLDLIMVSTNGSEMSVLQGAATTLSNNPNAKIIVSWKTDLISNPNTATDQLQALGYDVKIIHWDKETNTTSYKNQFTGEYPNDSLKVVQEADLLLE